MLISSNDLLGTAAIAARHAADQMDRVREGQAPHITPGQPAPRIADELLYAEAKLVQALTELRAARWGVTRRMPQFDDRDLNVLLDTEAATVRSAHGLIPAHT